jgi:MYXO-CTERM domain-containing protein
MSVHLGAGVAAAGVVLFAAASATRADQFVFNKLLDTTYAVPGGQYGNFTSLNLAAVDGASTAFVGSFTASYQTVSGLYRFDHGVATPIADLSINAPGGGGAFKSIVATGDYLNGSMVFAAKTADGMQGLYRYDSGNLSLLIRQGDTLPGGSATLANFPARGVAGEGSEFAFGAHRSDNLDGMYVTAGQVPVYIADERTRVPGPELGNFVDFPEVHMRDGRTAFVGRSLEADQEGSVVEPAGVFIATPGNPVVPVVYRGQLVPGGNDNDWRFNEFEKPRIDKFGRVAFTGGWVNEEEGGQNDERLMGVYAVNPDNTIKIVADSLMSFPDQHDDIEEFWGYTMDGVKPIVGMQDMNGGSYVYIANDFGPMDKVLDSYDLLDGKSISRIRFAGDTIEEGLLTMRVSFTDGSSALYTVQTPEPAAMGLMAAAGLVALRRRRA